MSSDTICGYLLRPMGLSGLLCRWRCARIGPTAAALSLGALILPGAASGADEAPVSQEQGAEQEASGLTPKQEALMAQLLFAQRQLASGDIAAGNGSLEALRAEVLTMMETGDEDGFLEYLVGVADGLLGANESAVLRLKRSIAKNPQFEPAHLALVSAFMGQNDWESAVAHLEAFRSSNPKMIGLSRLLADLYLSRNRFEAALDLYETISIGEPRDVEAMDRLHGLYRKLDALAAVEQRMDELVERGVAREVDKLIHLGRARLAQGRLEEANELIGRARKLDPHSPLLRRTLGLYYASVAASEAKAGDTSRAILFWKRAQTYLPNDHTIPVQLGFAYLSLREFQLAEDACQIVVEAAPDRLDLYGELLGQLRRVGEGERADRLIERGLKSAAAVQDEDTLHALSALREEKDHNTHRQGVLEGSIDDPHANLRLAAQLIASGDATRGRQIVADIYTDYQKRLQSDSRNAELHFVVGMASKVLGQGHRALESLQRAVDLEPSREDIQLALAHSQFEEGRKYTAIKQMKAALNDYPAMRALRRALGDIYLATQQREQAIEVFEELHATDVADAYALRRLGELYTQTRRYGETEHVFDQLIRMGEAAEADKLVCLASIRLSQAAYPKAKELLQQAQRLDPNNPALKDVMQAYRKSVGGGG